MKWKLMTAAAKKAVDNRGGTAGLKHDADQLRKIATGKGSAKEKAQRAATHFTQPVKKKK